MRLREVDSRYKMLSISMKSPKRIVGGLSHFRNAQGQWVRGNNLTRGGVGLKNIACDASQTVCAVAASPVMCTGLPKACSVNDIGTSPLWDELMSGYER